MNDHTITYDAHTQTSNLLDQAVAVLRIIRDADESVTKQNAIWAVGDMIERAHDLIGHT